MPMHDQRVWSVADAKDAETLAHDLKHTWTLCTGFRLGGYLFLNDSTSEDAIQEYAVVRERDLVQIESITFGWCSPEKALEYVRDAIAGKFDDGKYGRIDKRQIESPARHSCGLCA